MPLRPPAVLPFAALTLLGALPAQLHLPGSGHRFVDWSQDLAHPGAVVVVGTLGKWKEGKRERLADGKLGSGAQVASISGTQYFKVPVTAALQPRAVLHGKADGITLGFDAQVARLPDGKEHRQTSSGTPLEADTLALFVVVPKPKKGHELRAVIPFDKAVEPGADGEAAFVDTMRDHTTVNLRLRQLTDAIERLDGAKEPASRTAAAKALQELLAQKPELRQPKNDGLLTQHCVPLEHRAKKRLEELAKADAPK